MVDGFISRLAKSLPESQTREPFALYSRVAHVYPRHDESNWVSSHNDLKPENILFDGDRVWLVDWEAAFLNDRYVDLAVVANFGVNSEADEQAYLQRYFGESAGEYRLARFFLMRQVAHIFYAIVFLSLAAVAGKAIVLELGRPEDALAEYEKSMRVDPNRFNVLYGAVRAAELSNQREKATAYFAQLLANCAGGAHSDRPEIAHAKPLPAPIDGYKLDRVRFHHGMVALNNRWRTS